MAGRPGKTAPRLVEDLFNYDPRQRVRSGRNILTDTPPQFDEKKPPMSAVPGGSCRHKHRIFDKMFMKPEQCLEPLVDEFPNHTSAYKIASYCAICRFHFTVIMDFREGPCILPCPNDEFKQHHFTHFFSNVRGDRAKDYGPTELHQFKCSSEQCGAVVTITITPPRITREHERLLSDYNVLQARLRSARKNGPDRPDLEAARPVDPLYNLYAYIRDSLAGKPGKIPALNRKFLVSFGQECDELLEDMGFRKEVDENTNSLFWHAPKVSSDRNILEGDPVRDRLDDIRQELMVLIDKQPGPVKQTLKKFAYQPQLSREMVARALGSFNYDRRPNSRREEGEEDHPYYAGLGAVGDFSDSLLEFAYKRQIATDPQNLPYYFECLQDLATGRNSPDLDILRAIEESKGYVSRKDASQACSYFGFDIANINDLGDEYIISCFRSRMQDTSPALEQDVRQQLLKIGQYKQSQTIKDAASDTLETYDQALSWIGGTADMTDDVIVALAGVKRSESGDEAKVTQVIKIIAEYRKSDALIGWLTTGDINPQEMEPVKAWSLLGMSYPDDKPDLENLDFHIDQHKQINPAQAAEYDRAAATVRKYAGDPSAIAHAAATHPPGEWPVGIQNLGNTCYLNAILQFLFTIKPLRQLVLNIDEHLMEITPENMREKKVGNLPVTEDVVRRSQDFVRELQQLFKDMISAPGSIAYPRSQLVELALHAPADVIRPSGTDGDVPSASEVVSDNKSDETLVGDINGNDSTPQENVNGVKDIETGQTQSDQEVLPDAPSVSDTKNPQPMTTPDQEATATKQESSTEPTNSDAAIPPPDHPPPVPPRPNASKQKDEPPRSQRNMQQDASEILSNILYQLSCAIPAEGHTKDGEQLDAIKDLFFGQERVTNLKKDGTVVYETTMFESESVTVVEKPKGIYEAIDDSLDKAAVEGDSEVAERYTTLLHVPPILKFDVKRLGFDRVKQSAIRSEHHLGLEEILYIDRYLNKEEVLKRREEAWRLKKALASYRERRDKLARTPVELEVPDALQAASNLISDIQGLDGEDAKSPEETLAEKPLLDELANKATSARAEIKRLEDAIKKTEDELVPLFQDMTSEPYMLHSLFIHRGGASSGHYLVSIRDFERNMWRNYNDETVTEVTDVEKNIFGVGEPYAKILPTCVVYVRADLKHKGQDLVEALCRTPNEDVTMGENERVDKLPVTEGVDPGGEAGVQADNKNNDNKEAAAAAVASSPQLSDMTTVADTPAQRSDAADRANSPSFRSTASSSPSKRLSGPCTPPSSGDNGGGGGGILDKAGDKGSPPKRRRLS